MHAIAGELGVSKDAIGAIGGGELAKAVKRGRQHFIEGQSIIDWLKPEGDRHTRSTASMECIQ